MVATVNCVKSAPAFMSLNIRPEEMETLLNREYTHVHPDLPIYSYKCCPTVHGCSGATNCDNAYGDYHR